MNESGGKIGTVYSAFDNCSPGSRDSMLQWFSIADFIVASGITLLSPVAGSRARDSLAPKGVEAIASCTLILLST